MGNAFVGISTDELRREIARREAEQKQAKVPAINENPDLTRLVRELKGYVQSIVYDGYEEDDAEHSIYESTIETFYGSEFWDWLSKVTE